MSSRINVENLLQNMIGKIKNSTILKIMKTFKIIFREVSTRKLRRMRSNGSCNRRLSMV